MRIALVKLTYRDQSGVVKTFGCCDNPNYAGDSSGLDNGQWHDLLTQNETSWSEQTRHIFQGSQNSMDIGPISFDNSEGYFDKFVDLNLIGEVVEVRHVYDYNTNWGLADKFIKAKVVGKKYIGRSSFVLELESYLNNLKGPIPVDSWDKGETPNKLLEGKSKSICLGVVFQISPQKFDANELIFYCAENSQTNKVCEGGNPTDSAVPFENGFQLLRSPLLEITADISGPISEEIERVDLIESIGSFQTWSLGEPDGFTVSTVAGKSSVTEDPLGAAIAVTGQGDTDTGDRPPEAATSPYPGTKWEAVGAATLNAALQASDGSYAHMNAYLSKQSSPLTITPDISIPSTALIKGIEVKFTAKRNSSRGVFYRVTIYKSSGAIGIGQGVAIPDTLGVVTIGGNGETFGTTWNQQDINDGNLKIAFTVFDITGYPDTINVEVHAFDFKVYYSSKVNPAILYVNDPVLTLGEKTKIEVEHEDNGESISLSVGTAESVGEEISFSNSSLSEETKILSDNGVTEFSIVPNYPYLALKFEKIGSTGNQIISRISVYPDNKVKSTMIPLVSYLLELAGNEGDLDLEEMTLHVAKAGDPKMGWFVDNESVDDVIAKLVSSNKGCSFHKLEGLISSFKFEIPSSEETEIVFDADGVQVFDADGIAVTAPTQSGVYEVPENMLDNTEIESFTDPCSAMTLFIAGAKNQKPIPFDRSAGVTDTWTEEDKALVAADYRIIKKSSLVERVYDAEGVPVYDATGEPVYSL